MNDKVKYHGFKIVGLAGLVVMPKEVKLEPTPYLAKILKKAEVDIKAGRNISKAYADIDSFFDDMKKVDLKL